MNYQINLSPAAIEKVKEKLLARGIPGAALRLGLKGSGCSGYEYVIMFEDNPPTERDLQFIFDGVKVFIDKKSIIYLNGAELDWKNSLMENGFVFNNPNEKSTCGCKKSFSV